MTYVTELFSGAYWLFAQLGRNVNSSLWLGLFVLLLQSCNSSLCIQDSYPFSFNLTVCGFILCVCECGFVLFLFLLFGLF